jgi:hypothetical protein
MSTNLGCCAPLKSTISQQNRMYGVFLELEICRASIYHESPLLGGSSRREPRRPPADCFSNLARLTANRASANRRKIKLRTGWEYWAALRPGLVSGSPKAFFQRVCADVFFRRRNPVHVWWSSRLSLSPPIHTGRHPVLQAIGRCPNLKSSLYLVNY